MYEQGGKVRTALYDREWEYPFHIRRYPAKGSVVSTSQWKGVLMGRFVAAQELRSTLSDFKQAVFWTLQRAMERGFADREITRTWR